MGVLLGLLFYYSHVLTGIDYRHSNKSSTVKYIKL